MKLQQQKTISKRTRGAAMTELLVTMLGLVPLVMGTVQTALIYNAKEVLNYATYEAARAGSVGHAKKSPMKQALARGLVPLYGGGKDNTSLATSYGKALVDVYAPVVPFTKYGSSTGIDILSPTKEAFQDHGVTYKNQQQIPNEHLKYKERTVGSNSGVNLQDANLLKIKVTYGYKLFVPVINKIIGKVMLFADPDNAQYYLADPPRLPIVAMATVRMQSNAYFDDNESYPGGGGGTVPGGGGGTTPGGGNPGQGGDDTPPGDLTDTGDYDDTSPPADAPQTCEEAGTCDAGNPVACGGGAGNQSTNTAAVGVGNPINVVTGNKYQQEVDIASLPGKLGLEFVRHYNSQSPYKGSLGYRWRHTYDVRLNRKTPDSIYIDQADGRRVVFETRDADDENRVLANVASDGWLELQEETTTWHWHNGRKLKFDRDGRLNYVVAQSGQTIYLTYDSEGRLLQVNDPQERTLVFDYYPNNRIKRVIDPNGHVSRFTYDFVGNLSTVKYSDNSSRIYHYEDTRYKHHLTGLTDGRGVRFASWTYDTKGRANLSTHANGVEKVSLKFKVGMTLVTNNKGITSKYYTDKINNIPVVTRVDGPGCSTCGSGDVAYTYNDHNQLTQLKKKSGITTHYRYDQYSRLIDVSRSVNGSKKQKLFDYSYAGKSYKPASISRPSVVAGKNYKAQFKYNKQWQITETTEIGWMPAVTTKAKKGNKLAKPMVRRTQYRYSELNGRSVLTEIDGPLANGAGNSPLDSDISRFEYGNQDSYVTAVILPGNQRSSILYDSIGRVSQVITADGNKVNYDYDVRNKIKSIERDGVVQSYRYDADGRLLETGMTLNGQYKALSKLAYDAAGRNTWVARSLGMIDRYKYDTSSNIIEAVKQTASFKQTQSFKYDANDRLISNTDAKGATRELQYNAQDLVKQLSDPLGRVRKYAYDAYGALSYVIEAANTHQQSKIVFKNDRRGNTRSITGPNGAVTRYVVDDFGRNLAVISPDSGSRSKQYDIADRLIESVDALGNKLTYQYDHVGRLLSQQVIPAKSTEPQVETRFHWTGKKLAAVEHPNQRERYDYDSAHRLIRKSITLTLVDGTEASYVTRYNRDKTTGQVISKTLPDGSTLSYQSNAQNQLVSLARQTNRFSASQTIVSGISRDLVGLNGYTYGNGIEARLQRSADGALARIVHRLPDRQPAPRNSYAYLDALLPVLGINSAHAAVTQSGVVASRAADNVAQPMSGAFQLPRDPGALIDHRYLWDKAGNLRHSKNYSSTTGEVLSRQKSYIYDLHDQLIIAVQDAGLGAKVTNSQAVAVNNEVAKETEMWRYFYDDAGNRLLAQQQVTNLSEMGQSFKTHYQGKTNRATSFNRVVKSNRGVKSKKVASIQYDLSGRPLRQGNRNYKWDAQNYLTEVKNGKKVIAKYRYNHRGERISKSALIDNKQHIRHMLYEGRKLIAELDSAGKILRQYIYFAEQPVAVIDTPEGKSLSSGKKGNSAEIWLSGLSEDINGILNQQPESIVYLHLNHLGAPELATDSNATPVWQASYGPFGRVLKSSALNKTPGLIKTKTTVSNAAVYQLQLRLPGQYEDEETGLYYNDRRYYDPKRGQYLTPDPLGLRAGINSYAYVENNPLKYIDPTGLILFAFDGTFNAPNDNTNVNILRGIYQDNDSSDQRLIDIGADKPYYIEGVGENASKWDGAFAGSMIDRRMTQLSRLDKYVQTKVDVVGKSNMSKDNPLMITLDVIGFSRGAASARDFVNHVVDRANSQYYRNLPGVDGACVAVEVRFMGLFDTVLSKAPSGIDLGIPDAVQFASHAVAVNEHRGDFPLESIEPSYADIGFSSNRTERGFVGAHADIGGGYNGDPNDPMSIAQKESYDGGDLSDVALNWMVEQAKAAGVQMGQLDSRYRTVSNPIVHDERPMFPWNLKGANQDREVRYPNAPDNPYAPRSRQCARTGRNCTPQPVVKPVQRTAAIEGMTNADSMQFITPVTRTPPSRQCSRNGTNCPNNPPANYFGTVDMAAYNSWLSSNYGFSM